MTHYTFCNSINATSISHIFPASESSSFSSTMNTKHKQNNAENLINMYPKIFDCDTVTLFEVYVSDTEPNKVLLMQCNHIVNINERIK